MANLRQASIVLDNARALELFMRIVPEAASFLECFSFQQAPGNSQVAFIYDKLSPEKKDIQDTVRCDAHLQTLFQEAKEKLGKGIIAAPQKRDMPNIEMPDIEAMGMHITSVERGTTEGEHIGMQLAINLSNSRLSDVILDLAVRLINRQRSMDPNYSLAYFPTKDNAPEGYDGLKDSAALYDKLSKGFPEAVRQKDLEKLLPLMDHLVQGFEKAKLPQRHR